MKKLKKTTKACTVTPDEPTDMVERGAWMTAKLKTHYQKQCPKCQYWHIWTPMGKKRPATRKST